jgi:glycosyltransferase involved in cell wall biosynthesis
MAPLQKESAEPRRLLWKLHSLDHRLASTRYRALLPIQALIPHGYRSSIGRCLSIDKLQRADVVVFVRAFSREDLAFAQTATNLGVPVVLDICDNFSEYTRAQAENIQVMARYAAAITTSGPALATTLRGLIQAPVPIMVVSDGIESESMARIGRRIIRLAYLKEERLPLLMSASFWRRVFSKLFNKAVTQGTQWQARMRAAAARGSITHGGKADSDIETFKSVPGESKDSFRTLIWFGRAGGAVGRYGLSDIVDVASYLQQVAQRIRFRLIVVSNDRDGYEHLVKPLPIETQYLEWDNQSIRSHIRASDVAIIPNSRDHIAICKSANRAALALSLGVPVVATRTPAMEVFEGCVCFDNWVDGLYRYLTEPAVVQAHLVRAESVIKREFLPGCIARQWQQVLKHIKRQRCGQDNLPLQPLTMRTSAEDGSQVRLGTAPNVVDKAPVRSN